MTRRTVITIIGVLSDEYFNFGSVRVPCPISHNNGDMEAPRAYIRTNTADSVISFVRHINFKNLKLSKTAVCLQTRRSSCIELLVNLEYTWRLELSVHCASEVRESMVGAEVVGFVNE